MIASHNSFTYLQPLWAPLVLLAPWWRCQSMSIGEQYVAGVRYFDVRLRRHRRRGWVLCHGLADLPLYSPSLRYILEEFRRYCPGAWVRMVLERGPSEEFRRELAELAEAERANLAWAVVKRKWEVLMMREDHPRVVDLDWHFTGLKSLFTPIRTYARRHVPTPTEEQVADPETVYFCDYVEFGLKKNTR